MVKFNLIIDDLTTDEFVSILKDYLFYTANKLFELNLVTFEQINDDENFFYFVKQEKVRNDYSKIKTEHINLINSKDNLFLGFFTSHEAIDEQEFRTIVKFSKDNNMLENKIFVINNSSALLDYKIKYNSDLNVYKLNYLTYLKVYDMMCINDFAFNREKSGKFFMCFNRVIKRHRIGLLANLKYENLLENVNWSYVPTDKEIALNEPAKYFKPIMTDNTIEKLSDEIKYFINLSHKYSDYENDEIEPFTPQKSIKLTMVEDSNNYTNSYVNLTTESVFDERENVIHISEKTFKPFYYYQIPLILASDNHIKKVKETYDLDFFEDIVDLSYDDEVDDKLRLEKYINEVKRLNNIQNDIVDFYNKNQERFELNKQKTISFQKLFENDLKYFHEIIIWKKH